MAINVTRVQSLCMQNAALRRPTPPGHERSNHPTPLLSSRTSLTLPGMSVPRNVAKRTQSSAVK